MVSRRIARVESTAFKLNSQLNSANTLLGSWNNNDKLVPIRGASILRTPEATWNQRGPTAVIKIEDSHVFSSQLFLTGTWTKVDGGFSQTANACIAAGSCDAAPEILVDANGILQNSVESTSTSRFSDELKIDGSYFLASGQISHELSFGARYREYEIESHLTLPGGRNIGNVAGENLLLPPHLGFFYALRGEGPPVSQEYTSLWIQDTLTKGSWTINAGLAGICRTVAMTPSR